MISQNDRAAMRQYYADLYSRFGDNMFCPICSSRPCITGCRIGFETEDELVHLMTMLAKNDKPRRRKRKS